MGEFWRFVPAYILYDFQPFGQPRVSRDRALSPAGEPASDQTRYDGFGPFGLPSLCRLVRMTLLFGVAEVALHDGFR